MVIIIVVNVFICRTGTNNMAGQSSPSRLVGLYPAGSVRII